ncbi:MAG: AIR synthase-related protein [Desulfovibrionales bacterium]
MLTRFEVALKADIRDVLAEKVGRKITRELGMPVRHVRQIKVYTVAGLSPEELQEIEDKAVLHDPVLHRIGRTPLAEGFDWALEVGFRPGVTDNEARTASEAIQRALGLGQDSDLAVFTSTQYLLSGDFSGEDVEHIARDLLANELIQRFTYKSSVQWAEDPGFPAEAAMVTGQARPHVESIDLSSMNDEELVTFSSENVLALSLKEMHAIRDYYAREDIHQARAQAGLGPVTTDAELEVLAQTWSEHCKHKIFNSRIDYRNNETGRREIVDSVFSTFIQGSTKNLRQAMGGEDFCLSVFKDNAGVIRFTDEHSVCIKVETHNSPSALDPYGGALTGIVGVNRDPMGTGLGANLICNTDVFCFASPFHDQPLPPRLLHPRRVLEGVREGVEHGGNKSGIPTVNGGLVFEERYLGKPLVFCGTVGLMPRTIQGRQSHEKRALPGDKIIMLGGRIGKDGIHGATFSSEELHEGSPATAVQIGDPFTQRKMYDFIMRARDMGLYNAITDNGAGGLSSSVGEMAEDSGGCFMDLSRAPLKYDGLMPWEILISEAQERMTVAVPGDTLETFLTLAREMDVEASVLGEFTDSGYFHVVYGDRAVAYLEMAFLHEGVPQMELTAVWDRPEKGIDRVAIPAVADPGGLLTRMLGRLNICSREYIIRQYDHEVQGGSVVKPLVGLKNDGPGDAAVIRPVLDRPEGLVVSCGICPKFSDLDAYWMMANAVDEAVRNAIAVGGNPYHMAGVDNFCWCDPVQSEKTPDGHYKLAQLVRANQALAHFCQAYGVPCVSGKDSMKNDYTGGGVKISIPPTVLFSVISVIPDVNKSVTSDLKQEGDLVYLLGLTRPELGGSELAGELGLSGGLVPEVDALAARKRYRTVYQAVQEELVTGCHDLSDGGLGVGLAEMAIAGRLGVTLDLDAVPVLGELTPEEILYSESASRLLITIREQDQNRFEQLFAGQTLALIGRVTKDPALSVSRSGRPYLNLPVETLATAWKATLDW